MKLALAMIVKDGGKLFIDALKHHRSLFDQIVIVDTGTTDGTDTEAEELADVFIREPWEEEFSLHRNTALSHVKAHWFISLDADERLDVSRESLDYAMRHKNINAFAFELSRYHVNGTVEENIQVHRMFRYSPRLKWTGRIHEIIKINNRELKVFAFPGVAKIHHAPHTSDLHHRRNLSMLEKETEVAKGEHRASVWAHMTMAQFGVKDYISAYESAKKAIVYGRKYNAVWMPTITEKFAWSCYEIGKVDQGNRVIWQLQEEHPDFTDAFFAEAVHCSRRGELDKAIELLSKCIEMGDSPRKYWSAGGTGTWRPTVMLRELKGSKVDYAQDIG